MIDPAQTNRRWSSPLLASSGPLAVILISTALALLALTWMGFDLRLIAKALPGNMVDTHFEPWSLYQAIDNLLHRPTDLGYAPIFYNDPNPFATTNATYGIAFVTLPIYLISGGNIALVSNLYLILTFPLTAWAGYVLVRYLIDAPRPVAVLVGLMLAFSPFRFTWPTQIETLSMHLYLLSLYFLHRLLDTPRADLSGGLVVVFWLMVLTSPYLAVMFLFTGIGVLLAALIGHRERITPKFITCLAAASLAGLVLVWPFVAYRFSNPTFAAGHDYQTFIKFASRPDEWMRSLSQFSTSFHLTNFPGITPFALSLMAAWCTRRREERPPGESKRTFSRRDLVWLYGCVIVVGYLLSVGPEIRIGESISIPSPYRLLIRLPVFSGFRAVWRYVFLGVVGTGMLSACALTILWERLPRRQFLAAFSLITVILAIEFIPFDGGGSGSPLKPAPPDQKRLAPYILPVGEPAYAWLREQPPGTVFAHYPLSNRRYISDEWLHNQPMINGVASYVPTWFQEVRGLALLDPTLFQLMRDREVQYILVHRDLMTPNGFEYFRQQWQRYNSMWGMFPLVRQFGDIAVYAMQSEVMPALRYDFDGPMPGAGWSLPIQDLDANTAYRWTTEKTASVEFYLSDTTDVRIHVRIVDGPPHLLDSLTLTVNGEPVPLRKQEDGKGAFIFAGIIPRTALGGDLEITRFVFHTDGVSQVGSETHGLLFDWLHIHPLEPSAQTVHD